VPRRNVEPAPLPSGGVHDYFGSGTFDPEHFGDVGTGPLEPTESTGELPFTGDAVPSGASVALDVADLGEHPARTSGRGPAEAWPTGRSPESGALIIDPVEVRLAADYGPPPSAGLLSPLYAVRVVRRRGELESTIKRLAVVLAAAETKRDALLAATALELRGKALMVEGGDDLYAPVVEIERLALDRRSSLAGANADYDRRAQEIEHGAEALRREAARLDGAVELAARELSKQRELLERATAKKKRLYIEVRAIMDAAEKSGGAFSSAQSTRIAELEAAVAAHNPELERAQRATEEAEAAHATAEAEGRQVARRLAEASRVRRSLDDEFRKQIGVRSEGVEESERERAQALADVMRRILAGRGRMVDVPKDVLAGIAEADRAVHSGALELEKLVRALDSYDRGAYRRGRVVIGIVLALAIVAIAVGFFV
jgi:hypothetical protein